jgi:spore coat polysaccharide biosynthesis protein SpsF (cytidylyltransferase family)
MTTAAIVQARISSTRLPGKVLLDLAGKPVLRHVLERCRGIRSVDVVVCAVPDEPASASLEAIAAQSGAAVFRGSEQDVLGRYLGAARSVNAGVILRVTSDCPLIDPDICADVLALRTRAKADYGCNNMPPTFPHGLDCEAFTADALALAATEATERRDREHVTPWLRRSLKVHRVNLSSDDPAFAAYRWTLDHPEDMDFFRALAHEIDDVGAARMREIIDVLRRNPELSQINSNIESRRPS